MEDFNVRLKELRKLKGLTQKQVAETIGVTEQGYQKYEYGKRTPTFDSLIKISKCFNVSLDYLMLGREFANH